MKIRASIRAGSIILPGLFVGGYVMVATSSLISNEVKNFTVVVGNLAKQIGYVVFVALN